MELSPGWQKSAISARVPRISETEKSQGHDRFVTAILLVLRVFSHARA
jgi:hypothetical protein